MKKNVTAIFLALSVTVGSLMLGACAKGLDKLPLPDQEHSLSSYMLDSGDVLTVKVYGEDDISGDYTVDGSGHINMPLVDAIYVKDKSIRHVAEMIKAQLQDGYLKNPKVSIDVQEYRPFYIVGEVREPGHYPYVSGMTVFNAVAMGGGFSYRADRGDIVIKRRVTDVEGVAPEPVNYEAELDSYVLPGDIIEIEERLF